jgi:RNA polymerase sigma-70 factor, ECF subfamily
MVLPRESSTGDEPPDDEPPHAPVRLATRAEDAPAAAASDTAFAQVLEQARALDKAALATIYQRYVPLIYRYIAARVRDTHVTEDLTSEVFVNAVTNIAGLRADDELTFAAWLLRIARNVVFGHYRKSRARPPVGSVERIADEPAASAEAGDPLDVVTAREDWSEVVVALHQLTEDQRNVLLYRTVLGYTTDEVARLLGKRTGTIRALQFRALASLARLLDLPRDAHASAGTEPRAPRWWRRREPDASGR